LPITISSGILNLLNTSPLSKKQADDDRYDKVPLGVMARFAVAEVEALAGAAQLEFDGALRFRIS
jgi:hypothetical protein